MKYCSQQVYQDRTLAKLRAGNPAFTEALRELESSPACQSLAMHSFLMLPMQVRSGGKKPRSFYCPFPITEFFTVQFSADHSVAPAYRGDRWQAGRGGGGRGVQGSAAAVEPAG